MQDVSITKIRAAGAATTSDSRADYIAQDLPIGTFHGGQGGFRAVGMGRNLHFDIDRRLILE